MKSIKKIFAVLMAMIIAVSLATTTTAFADEKTYEITINNSNSGHTYEAYQIFTGSLSSKGVLSDINWGAGISDAGKTAMGDAAVKAETLKSEADAKNFANEISQYLTTPQGTASTVVNGKYVISGLTAGYYLIKDKDDSLQGGSDAYTSYILKVVSDVTTAPKSDTPQASKKVKDINDTDGTTTDWQDSADYDINDRIPFQLSGTLPSNYDAYNKYHLTFHDTQSAGLTFDKDSVKVFLDGTQITEGYTLVTEGLTDGCTFEVRFSDVKSLDAAHSGSVITVEYESVLNTNAVIGSQGNPNTMNMEYSNNPNDSQGGETGTTPDDTVIVFTYKTVVNKVDNNGNKLAGAEFTLEKKMADGTWKAIEVVKNADGTAFTFSGLDDGDYRLTETVTPEGFNSIAPIEFTITATHDIISDSPALTGLNGEAESGEITFTSNTAGGSLTTKVVNKKGSTLPSTGGIGTTIFYVIGSVLVVGAAIFLISRKRMNAVKEK